MAEVTSAQISEQVNSGLSQLNLKEKPFSNSALLELQTCIGDYIKDVISESIRVSRGHNADSVSLEDVKRARSNLVQKPGQKVYRHVGTIGGILLGTGLSTFVSMLLSSTFSVTGVTLAVLPSVMGAFMIALHIAHD